MTDAAAPPPDLAGRGPRPAPAVAETTTPSRSQIGLAILGFLAILGGPMLLLLLCSLLQDSWAADMHRRLGGFWRAEPSGWALLATMAFTFVILVTAFKVKRARVRGGALLAIALALAATDAAFCRGYVAVSQGGVRMRPEEPWAPAIRFALADAEVVARGCHHRQGYRGDDDFAVFEVRSAAGGPSVNLAQTLSGQPRLAADLVAALKDLPPAALTRDSALAVRHDPQCLDVVSSRLDPAGRQALIRLLGPADPT